MQLGCHVGQPELQGLEVCERTAELLALLQVRGGRLQAGARTAQRAGSDVHPPAVEPHHGEAEACTLGAKRSAEHTSELQSLMRISYAVFCLKKKTILKYT